MKDTKIRIVGIPLVSILFMFIHSYGDIASVAVAFQEFFISLVFTFTFWEGIRAIVIYMRRVFPHNEQTAKRLIVQSCVSIVFTFAATWAIIYLFSFLNIQICGPKDGPYARWMLALTNLVPNFFVTSIYEGAYFFSEWKQNFQRSEALAKENIRSQFEALKNQLDPHFLFNSLNTLAALIDESNEPAQKYLEQLSDVYRYVLVSKQKETVPLHEELAFVDSYIYLNKTRFRDNLIVENELPASAMQQLVPPLSIQILVENAIKHNIVSKDKPLTLRLSMDTHGYMTVENNVQKKNTLEKSTQTGLQNMINRYALLTSQKVEVLHTDDIFSVKIPPLTS